MPARKRSELVDPNEVGVYFCWSRCVRRLKSGTGGGGSGHDTCGPLTENPARRHWFDRRLEALASVFAIELNEYSVLDHTVNTLLTIRPDIAAQWSDEEVVRRWARLSRKKLDLVAEELSEEDFQELVKDSKYVEDKRKRLSDLSWFMIELKEPISLAANREDGTSGHGFAERFGCERLRTQDAILQVTAEIVAQAVRSGLAESPESAELTSYHDRLEDDRAGAEVEIREEQGEVVQSADQVLDQEKNCDECGDDCQAWCRAEVQAGARTDIQGPFRDVLRSKGANDTHACAAPRCSQHHSDHCRGQRVKADAWRPKSGWMTPGGSEGDGYDGVAAGRRVTNASHLTIERELFDELLGKWCQQGRDAIRPRVSVPAELPEELVRLGFDAMRWSEAYRRTARRFDWLARKAEGMRRDFARVWNGGRRGAVAGNRGENRGGDATVECLAFQDCVDADDKVRERSD